MLQLSVTRVLLFACIVSGCISLILESIALANDTMWNNWLEKEIKKNNNTAPESLVERKGRVMSHQTPKDMKGLIKALKRNMWLEPFATALIIASLCGETIVFIFVLIEKIKERSRMLGLIFCLQILLHLIYGMLIVWSIFYYETGFWILSTATVVENEKVYGGYKELTQCTAAAEKNDPVTGKPKPKPVKYACQLTKIKISSAVMAFLVTFLYAIGFYTVMYYPKLSKTSNKIEPNNQVGTQTSELLDTKEQETDPGQLENNDSNYEQTTEEEPQRQKQEMS